MGKRRVRPAPTADSRAVLLAGTAPLVYRVTRTAPHIPQLRGALEAVYLKYNRPELVHPDPLEFLYRYDDPADREIVGLVAACLAHGNVKGILRSVELALSLLGDRPGETVRRSTPRELRRLLAEFRHRFNTGLQLTEMLLGVRRLVWLHGSLAACFGQGLQAAHETVLPALTRLVGLIDPRKRCGHLLARPERGSACKRLHLYLRWMVRADAVDPGGWPAEWQARLVVPLDVHMYRIARQLGLTARKAADARTALEVTAGFRRLCPEDPVRYDFALTRLGIRDDTDPPDALSRWINREKP